MPLTIFILIFSIVSFPLIAETVQPQKQQSVKPAIVISSLPDNIKLIVGEKEQFYAPRVHAIHALSFELPQDQIDALYEFLYKKIETQTLPDLEFNGLKNELVVALMRQKKKPEELAGHLVKIYKDKSYDINCRDYCVQFFGKWYHDAPDNQGKKDMVAGLWEALKNERHNKIGGAAGSQLGFLTTKYEEIDAKKVSEACFEALNDPECANISRVSLIQVCAQLGNQKLLPSVRTIAANDKDPILRASAIAAIGYLGDQSDLQLLEGLAASRDMRVQRPALGAIAKIKKK